MACPPVKIFALELQPAPFAKYILCACLFLPVFYYLNATAARAFGLFV